MVRDALGELEAARTGTRHYGLHGEARREEGVAVFIESFALPPSMVIFGAIDFTAALARLGQVLGYRVTVCDARPVFATKARFPMADEVVVDWPDRLPGQVVGKDLGPRDAVCVLTHDPKFDVPAIHGRAGDRRRLHRRHGVAAHPRQAAGTAAGGRLDDDGLARVMAPIGLDIGARTPEETAVSASAPRSSPCGRARPLPAARQRRPDPHSGR